MKEFIKKNKKYIKETLLLLLGGIIINLACFLIGTIYSHAESQSALGSMPYNCIDFQEYQSCISDEDCQSIINYISSQKSQYQSVANYIPNWDGSDVVMEINDANNDWVWVTVFYKPITYDSFTFNESYNFIENSFNLKATDSVMTVVFKPSTGAFGGLQFPSGTNVVIGGQSSSVSSYFGNYLPRYPFFYNGDPVLNSQGKEVFISRVNGGISVGDFTELPGLDEILNNIQNTWEPPSTITGHALPSQPTENPNNNDFQNRLQMFDYLKDSINAIIGNLGYNIKNWLDNLIGKIVDGFNSVSQNIYNGFKTLMDNIKDFFGAKIDAIIDKFNYITEPLSTQELTDNLNNANFSSDFLGLTTTVSSFASAFTSGTEPSTCSFTLDFSNSYYDFGVCEFSLDWILPFRPGIRLIIGCLCVYSLIVSIFTSLNTYIGGTSSINDDI